MENISLNNDKPKENDKKGVFVPFSAEVASLVREFFQSILIKSPSK
jgi:hypothetical protein